MPDLPKHFHIPGLYARYSCVMRAVRASASSQRAFSVGSHSSAVDNVEGSPEDVVAASIEDNVARNEVTARPFDPQK